MDISGAELIIELLEQQGVGIVAGMPGGALLPLYEALGGSSRLRHVLVRHEQAAGFIAQGMARLSGRAGICCVTSGPGVTNVVTALADAKRDSVPLVCIAGQVATHLIGTDAFQEVPTRDIVRGLTKGYYFVKSASDIVDVFADAFQVAEHGRPGPVLIDLPKNVQSERIPREKAKHPAKHRAQTLPSALPRSTDQSLAYDRAAALIALAERPVLYLGGGIISARAHALVRQLAEQTDIPVTTTLMALGLLPQDHALNLGMLGMHGARYTNHVIDAADLLIGIGVRFDDRVTGNPALFAPGAPVVCLTGDGSLLLNLQELATLAELDLDVKIILLDNAALGLVRQQQELFYHKRYVGSRYARPTDFVAIASAFRIRTKDLGCESEPGAALEQAMNLRGPWLIRVPIDESEHLFPFVAPGAANTQSLDHPQAHTVA